jgi:hypothetical protein
MSTTKNSTTNGNHSAVLKHSWAGIFPCHGNGKVTDAGALTQLRGIREFFSLLGHDRKLRTLLSGTVLAGLLLGGCSYAVAITLFSRLAT